MPTAYFLAVDQLLDESGDAFKEAVAIFRSVQARNIPPWGGGTWDDMRLSRDVAAIAPFHSSSTANATIPLGSRPVRLSDGRHHAEGTGHARLELAPRNRLVVSVTVPATGETRELARDPRKGELAVRFGEMARPARMLARSVSFSSSGSVSMELLCRAGMFTICSSRRARLASLTLHVLNFPNFIGRDDFIFDVGGGTQRRLGRILLKSDEWEIEMQALPDTKRIVEELKAAGGYAITHIARITRTNGGTFSVRDGERVVAMFHKLVSFAAGRWTAVFGATGVNSDGEVVYEEWAGPPSAPWGGRLNWFDEHHGEALSDLFAGFIAALKDPKIGLAISAAHYWYLRSNRGGEAAGADGSLILSQAALEGLATGYLAGFGKPAGGNAAERIRRLLAEIGVPVSIPKEFRNLRHGQRKGAWQDGPHAITKVRNELVHPEKRSPVPVGKSVIEAWQLAQWYLELAILRASGYSGNYSSRLTSRWVGEVEPVPWARNTP